MSVLFLADQLRHSFKRMPSSSSGGRDDQVSWPPLHIWAVLWNIALVVVSVFCLYTTSVYFHTPFEKLTGFLLGVFGFALTQIPILLDVPHLHDKAA
ncbi:hypothetical protein EUX98_g4244 [Antrodiella citrinella]|uniref:Uncharacterized protein n=1 Tax=Antrodiella citrinella TaxID=2447956 RepID=A0A4S4MUF8_9APHY|nr:hypothetical protein EUX98_g4244 [Antrodiella citrinella]